MADDPNQIRGPDGIGTGDAGLTPVPPPGAGIAPNRTAELLSDLLEATGLITREQLVEARERAGSGSLATALAGNGPGGDGNARARAIAAKHHLPFIDFGEVSVAKEAVEAIPTHVLERVVALPYGIEGNILRVAIADPSDVHKVDELKLATRHTLELGVAPAEDIELELRKVARATEVWERAALVEDEMDLEASEEEDDDLEADDGVSDAPLVRLVNSIILQAAEDGASDLHFDPQDDALVVRLRVDGVLHEVQRIPKRLAVAVTTRLKVLAKLDIAERRKPQDGRISLNAKAAGRLLDIRVAVLPSVEGEMVVMRLIDKSKRLPTLGDLGFSDEMRARLEEVIRKPTGALLVTGPTGSGKSTTLYASLEQLNRPEINVITVEDPVEYRMLGLNQVQVNPKAGLTFASALRSILRSDPDVVMVGEIRDVETAKMAIEAALTGHFVLSTLHTNDAPSALTRLNEMGVEPFLTGSAVTAVVAQRLARKLCTHCCEMYIPTHEEMLNARFTPEQVAAADGVSLYRRKGCPRCNQTGYKGRIGIYQLMVMTEDLSRLAATHASRDEIERSAMEGGMKTLWDDGLAKVASGLTSIEELGRVLVQ
ncbi:MAG TPA: ATPase, T2SS/T4P/T4SS family [Gaiellaceae bacterium]|nr:ATPase, T2SS/T4P/T4SS family [Gaiellaceae bacterium]